MPVFVVLVAMLALMCSTARAQHAPDWVVRQYTALNGLPVNSAIAAALGPHGFLWLATHNGLVRFDGANFQVYDAMRAPDMQGNRIRQLVKDHAGRLYALTEQGDWLRVEADRVWRADLGADAPLRIAEVDPDSLCLTTTGALYCPDGHGAFGKFVSFPAGTRAAYAVRGPGDIVWLRTQANSVWLHRHGHWQRMWQPQPGQPVAFAPLATIDADGSLWLGVGANLLDTRMLHLGLSGQATRFAGDRDPAHVLSFHRAPGGGILILGQDGLFELRNARMHRFPVDFHIETGPDAIAVQRAADGAIWLTVKDRLWRLSPELLKNGGAMPKPVLVSPGGINSVTLGPQDLVWVMTQDHGFYRLSRPRVDVLGSGTGVPVTNVYSVARDASGNMWLASFGDGIVCVHPDGRIDQYGAANGLPKLTRLVASAPDGSVYAAQYDPGLYRLAPGSQHFVPLDLPPALQHDKIRAVTFDSTGRMWIGTSNGAWRLQAGQWQRVWPEASRRMLVYAIVPTDHGTWYATDHGIWHQRGHHDLPIAAQLLGRATVRNLRFTSDGALWASTAGHGLVRIAANDPTGEHPLQLGRPNGLPSNDPHTVRQDADGNIWVNSNQGIFRIAPDALQALLAGRRSKLSPLVLGRADGLTELEGNGGIQPAAAWDIHGRLWFPSQAGVVRFDPLAIQPRGKPPQPVITGVDSAGRSLDLSHDGVLPLGVRDLRVSYAEANLLGSGNSRFRYRLLPLDRSWTATGAEHSVVFASLAPGNYRFELLAANSDGVWNTTPSALAFTVQAYWYETAAFKAIVAALIGLATLLLVRWRLHRLHHHTRALDDLVRRRTLELRAANAALERAASHDFLTGLPNRRAFVKSIDAARAGDQPLALAILDVDYFKAFNDTLGHVAGDHCLERFGGLLKAKTELPGVLAARIGGEEFALLFQGAAAARAGQTLDVLLDGLHTLDIKHPASSVSDRVTFSAGLADRAVDDTRPEDLIRRADGAMYLAKKQGRDRWVHVSDTPATYAMQSRSFR